MSLKIQNYKKFLLHLFSISVLILLCISCRSSDGIEVEFEDGINEPIRELLGDDLLNVLENELNFPIYRGKNPPNIEVILLLSDSSPTQATIVLDPTILETTNVPGDAIKPGDSFRDTFFRFSNQNMKDLTIDFDRIVLGSNPFIGFDSFIIGNGRKFSVFGKQEEIVQKDTVISVNFFSGIVKNGGISSAKGGIIVINNKNIGLYIPNGTGRLFQDEDGFAELREWPSTGEFKGIGINDVLMLK